MFMLRTTLLTMTVFIFETVSGGELLAQTINCSQTPGVDCNLTNNSVHQAEVSIATSPINFSKMVVAGHGDFIIRLHTWHTEDAGTTWQRVAIQSQDGFADADVEQRADPSVAIAADGTVFVGYVLNLVLPDITFPDRVMCARSTDNGQTYSFATVSNKYKSDRAYVSVGPRPNGQPGYNVYATYDVAGTLYLATSPDGVTFVDLSSTLSITGSHAHSAVAGNGDVYVAWLENYGSFPTTTVRTRRVSNIDATLGTGTLHDPKDLGLTYVAGAIPGSGGRMPIPAAPSRGVSALPSIAVDRSGGPYNGRVYVAYVTRTSQDEENLQTPEPELNDADGNDTDIVLQYSKDQGVTWTTPVVIHKRDANTNSQFHPWVAVDQQSGAVAVCFLSTRNDALNHKTEAWAVASTNGGDTWYEQRLSDASLDQSCYGDEPNEGFFNYGEYNGASVAGGVIRAVWTGATTTLDCVKNVNNFSQFIFDKVNVSTVTTFATRTVPSPYATVQAALDASEAGDVVQVTGNVNGTFTMAGNITVVPAQGVTPILDSNNGSVGVTFPIRYNGPGLSGFTITGFSSIGVKSFLQPTHVPTVIRLTNCTIRTSRNTAIKGLEFTNVDTAIVKQCLFDDTLPSGGPQSGIETTGGISKVENSTFTMDSAWGRGIHFINAKKLSGGLPANRVYATSLTGGPKAIEATNSYTMVEASTLTDQTVRGISVTFSDPDALIHTRVSGNLMTSVSGGTSEGVYIGGFGTDPAGGPKAEVIQNTINGWGIGAHVEQVAWSGTTPRFITLLTRNMITQFATKGISVTPAPGLKAGTITHSKNNSYSTLSSDTGIAGDDVSEPPLYCDNRDATVQKYTLRIDSPGAPGNSGVSQGIGSKPVECAWGTLVRNTLVEDDTPVRVLEDLIVPATPTPLSLTLDPGVVFAFDNSDNSATGYDVLKNELTVRGTLTVSGTLPKKVRFEAADGSQVEGTWYGINSRSTATVNINFASIKHAVYGVLHQSNIVSTILNSDFSLNQNRDMVIGSGGPDICPVTVQENTMTVGGGDGIELASEVDQAVLLQNTITGSSGSLEGIRLGVFSEGEVPTIRKNVISGFISGPGILNFAACNPVVVENDFQNNQRGIRVNQGAPQIGETNTKNRINSNIVAGLLITGNGALPRIRHNDIGDNPDGVAVESGANPDVGISSGDPGNNNFVPDVGSNDVCIRNVSSPQVRAQGNYFGPCGGPPCWIGSVDAGNPLCSPPASMLAEIGVLGEARQLVVLGAQPNPTSSRTAVHFSLKDGWSEVETDVFDLTGRLVRSIPGRMFGPGEHSVEWDGRNAGGIPVGGGVYFVRLTGNQKLQTTVKLMVTH